MRGNQSERGLREPNEESPAAEKKGKRTEITYGIGKRKREIGERQGSERRFRKRR